MPPHCTHIMSRLAVSAIMFVLIGNLIAGVSAHASETQRVNASQPADAASVYAFGRHLLALGDHYRAITELKRFSILFPDDPRQPATQLLLGLAYQAEANYDTATAYFRRLHQNEDESDVNRLALFKLGEMRLQQRQYPQAVRLFQRFLKQFPDGPLVNRTQYLLGLSQTLEGDVQAAKPIFESLAPESIWAGDISAIQQILEDAEPRPSKSPRVAGILAGILPGAGHLYLGKPRHAITAFLLNGLFLAGATFAFLEGLEAPGVILLYFETGWYLGNIRSAREGALDFNRRQIQDVQGQLFTTHVPPGLTFRQLPGIGLKINF